MGSLLLEVRIQAFINRPELFNLRMTAIMELHRLHLTSKFNSIDSVGSRWRACVPPEACCFQTSAQRKRQLRSRKTCLYTIFEVWCVHDTDAAMTLLEHFWVWALQVRPWCWP